MRNYADKMREEFRSKLFVDDTNAIPPARTFRVRVPCGIAHPGLCPHKTPTIFNDGLRVMHNLETFCKDHCVCGTTLLISSTPARKQLYVTVGYIRQSDPFVVVVVECRRIGDSVLLCEALDGDLRPLLFSEVAAEFLLTGRLDSIVAKIVTATGLPHTSREVIVTGFEEEREVLVGELAPLGKAKADQVDKGLFDEEMSKFAQGFKRVAAGGHRPQRAPRRGNSCRGGCCLLLHGSLPPLLHAVRAEAIHEVVGRYARLGYGQSGRAG